MIGAFLVALPAFLIALGGIGVALLWFAGNAPVAIAIVAAPLVVGTLLGRVGRRITAKQPQLAIYVLEGAAIAPAALAIGVTALLVVAGARFEFGEAATAEQKSVAKIALGAIIAYFTAAILKGAKDVDENWIGKRVRSAFHSSFQGRLQGEAKLAVFSEPWKGLGWTWRGRRARAAAVAAELHLVRASGPE